MGCACEKEREDPSSSNHKLSRLSSKLFEGSERQATVPILSAGFTVVKRLTEPFESLYDVLETKTLKTGEKLLKALPQNLKKECTVRVIPKHLVLALESELPQIHREICQFGAIDHPNVLTILALLEDDHYLYIVTENFLVGEFERYFRKRERMTERLAGKVLAQVFSALNYCHQLGISQRRLQLSSLLMQTEAGDQSLTMKVSVGEGQLVAWESRTQVAEECCWMAPEVLAGKYTEKSDIWSCGVLLYFLLTGQYPFAGDTPDEVMAQVRKGFLNFREKCWRSISHDAISFVSCLLNPACQNRPSAQACLSHPWAIRHAGKARLKSRTVGRKLWRLKRAAAPVGLRRAIERYMLERMGDKEEIAIIAEAFRALDEDGDGAISLKELQKGLRKRMSSSKSQAAAEQVFHTIDFNNSGALNYSEFLLAAINTEKLLCSANLRVVFDSFDKDKSGQISAGELRELLMMEGVEQMEELWQQLISMTDTSGDGELDFEEFEDLMTKMMV